MKPCCKTASIFLFFRWHWHDCVHEVLESVWHHIFNSLTRSQRSWELFITLTKSKTDGSQPSHLKEHESSSSFSTNPSPHFWDGSVGRPLWRANEKSPTPSKHSQRIENMLQHAPFHRSITSEEHLFLDALTSLHDFPKSAKNMKMYWRTVTLLDLTCGKWGTEMDDSVYLHFAIAFGTLFHFLTIVVQFMHWK